MRRPRVLAQPLCQGGFCGCQSLRHNISTTPVAQHPFASAFPHSILSCKTATAAEVTTVIISTNGEGCSSAQSVPVKHAAHETNTFPFSKSRLLVVQLHIHRNYQFTGIRCLFACVRFFLQADVRTVPQHPHSLRPTGKSSAA